MAEAPRDIAANSSRGTNRRRRRKGIDARADTLAAIRRALRPGGLLVMQELFPPLDAQQEASPRAQLDRLFYRQQDVAFGLSAEDLAAEAEAAGFQDTRIVTSPMGRLVIARR